MPFSRRHLRRWTARVLALWLFGIGAGLGNICLAAGLLEAPAKDPARAVGAAATGTTPAAVPPNAHGHEHEAGPGAHGGGHGSAHDAANCQDFCDKLTLSLPISKSAPDHVDQAMASPPSAAFVADPAGVRMPSWTPRPLGSLDPPVRVAFARLAL